MIHDLPIQTASIVAIWLEALLFGVHCIVFATSCYVLLPNDRRRVVGWPLLIASTILFLLSMTHTALGLRTMFEAYIVPNSITTESVIGYWANPSTHTMVARNIVYIVMTYVADGILIWRLWLVWNRNVYVSAFAIVLYVTVIITGGIASGKATSLNPTDTLFIIQLEEWLVATWAVEVALNSIVTGLIVYRIWSVGRIAAKSNIEGKHPYKNVIISILESGALYTFATIVLIATFTLHLEAGAIVDTIATQMAAIAPTLIIVRSGLGHDFGSRSQNSSGTHTLVQLQALKKSSNSRHWGSSSSAPTSSTGNVKWPHTAEDAEVASHLEP